MRDISVRLQITTMILIGYGIVRIMKKEHNWLFIRLLMGRIFCILVLRVVTGR
jgi:hypothetical protein